MILYFPVSALVTLFANILQNPQDARARSDVKLMNQVVNFLSLLAVTEEQGGVKRMLGVCAEFERIARVVLERAEKEAHSGRKRRSSKIHETDPTATPQHQQVPQKRGAPPTPQSNHASTPRNIFTPAFSGDLENQPFNPSLQGFSPSMSNIDLSSIDFSSADFNSNLMPSSNGLDDFTNGDITNQPYTGGALNGDSFQQPFVPQDLWQMPMTLEWDWADMGVGAGVGINGFQGAFDAGQQEQNRNEM